MKNMSLLKFEFKKLLGHRYLIIFAVSCLIVNGCICFINTDTSPETPYVRQLLAAYEDDPAPLLEAQRELRELEDDYNRLYIAYIKGQLAEEPQLIYPCNYSGQQELNDALLLGRAFECIAREDEYRAAVAQYIDRAIINKGELLSSYGEINASSFAYRKQALIERRYTQVLEQTRIFPEAGRGWDELFSYDAVNLWMLLAVIAGTITLVLSEQGSTSMILRCAKKGRLQTALAKSMALVGWVLCVLVAFTATTMLAVLFKCGGYSSLTNSIAIFEEYTATPIALTVGELLALMTAVRALALCVCGVACACVCMWLRSIPLSFAATVAAVGIQYAMLLFGQTDGLKYLNIVGAMSLSSALSNFKCVSILGYAAELLPLMVIGGAALAIIGTVIFVSLFRATRLGVSQRRPSARLKLIFAAWRQRLGEKMLPRRLARKRRTLSTHLLAYEWRKLFTSRGVILLLLLTAICKPVAAHLQYDAHNSYALTLYSDYIEAVQGEQSDEKRSYIEAENRRIETVIDELPQRKQEFYAGNLSYDRYREILEEYNTAVSREEVAERVLLHSEYLDRLAATRNIEACYLYDIDWLRLFEAGADILLMALLAYLSAGIFSDEYKTNGGCMPIVSAAKKGRAELYRKKLLLALSVSLTVTLLFNAVDAACIIRNFKLPDGGSPLQSLERFGGVEYSGSICRFVALTWGIQLFTALIAAAIVTLLGALIKNRLYTLLCSFSLLFVPMILKRLGLTQFAYFDIGNGFDAEQLWLLACGQDVLKDHIFILLYFIGLSTAFAVLLFITYRKARDNK